MRKIINLTITGTIETEDNLFSLLSNYPERLKQRRKDRGLTLKQLGEMSGLSGSAVARIEKGERTPSIDTVAKLEKALEGGNDNTE